MPEKQKLDTKEQQELLGRQKKSFRDPKDGKFCEINVLESKMMDESKSSIKVFVVNPLDKENNSAGKGKGEEMGRNDGREKRTRWQK